MVASGEPSRTSVDPVFRTFEKFHVFRRLLFQIRAYRSGARKVSREKSGGGRQFSVLRVRVRCPRSSPPSTHPRSHDTFVVKHRPACFLQQSSKPMDRSIPGEVAQVCNLRAGKSCIPTRAAHPVLQEAAVKVRGSRVMRLNRTQAVNFCEFIPPLPGREGRKTRVIDRAPRALVFEIAKVRGFTNLQCMNPEKSRCRKTRRDPSRLVDE